MAHPSAVKVDSHGESELERYINKRCYLSFYLHRLFLVGQPETSHNPHEMGIGYDGSLSSDMSYDDVGTLATYSGNCQQLFQGEGDLSSIGVYEGTCGFADKK